MRTELLCNPILLCGMGRTGRWRPRPIILPASRRWMSWRYWPGKITNAAFSEYLVPRFADVPEIEVELVNRPDIPSAGAGETPIICIAPAIANAVYHATGVRVREMPIRLKT